MSVFNRQPKSGFTLVEILIAVVWVGLAITSLVASNSTFTKANACGVEISTGEFLIEQIRELTMLFPVIDPQTETATFGPEESALADYDDLDDFDDASFSPPIGTDGEILDDFAAFGQTIKVENVNPANFEQAAADHGSSFVRVTVKVFLGSKQIGSARWIRARY